MLGLSTLQGVAINENQLRYTSAAEQFCQDGAHGSNADDDRTLMVQCVMTSRPYGGPEAIINRKGNRVPGMKEAGARRGVGLRLAQALLVWAGDHEWKRIVADAHADIDCMYGITGKGGLGFWRKAGFSAIGTHYDEPPDEPWLEEWRNGVESQAKSKGMTKKEAWTWHRMMCEVQEQCKP